MSVVRHCSPHKSAFSHPQASIVGLVVALMLSSCGPSKDTAADPYRRAQDAERLDDCKDAEKHYLDCVSAAKDCQSEYYQLAAINRLSDLEKALHSHSKAKTYMIKAATLAENTKDPDADKPDTESLQLAKEKHTALIRPADWEFEDGNYISARKLFEKAAVLEPHLKIDPEEATSATARITKLDKRAIMEHEQVSVGISKQPAAKQLRGPAFAKRMDDRRHQFDRLHRAVNEFSQKGGKELGRKVLDRLAELRTEYGVREGEYRNNLSWNKERRVIARCDYTDKGVEMRYVVTNIQHLTAREIYEEIYCKRALAELGIKNIKETKGEVKSILPFTNDFNVPWPHISVPAVEYE